MSIHGKSDTYDLHQLGWSSFQQLCLTIVREVLGQTVESFLDSNDGGRDGAFAGTWIRLREEALVGRFVIQCKFTSKLRNLRMSELADELKKVRKLVKDGVCDVYVLMTNAGISGDQARKVRAKFLAAGAKHVVCYGQTWINQQIRENKKLRMLVPRVYGLGDLSQILDERAYAQARAILEGMREDLAKVVVTDAYRRAVAALDRHGFVLLIGEPAAGKSTIASLLAMAAVDQWGASILKPNEPSDVTSRWNPDVPSQFFWLDDAFGVSQYEYSLASGWNRCLPQLKTMLRHGAKIVMTSRDYIYNRARRDLKEGAFPLLGESQVVIDVHGLEDNEKRQILYNHLKLGKQSLKFRKAVKPHLESIATHSRFIPEIARRLSEPLFTGGLLVSAYSLAQFVERREQLLREVLQGLDADSKAALALIYMRNDRLKSPIELEESERSALERLGSTVGGCIGALEALKDSLVQHMHADNESFWRFKHPTIGDAYAGVLADSPELLGIFVQGSTTDKLVEQVTCGDVGIQKSVILPKALFPLMLEKLRKFSTTRHKSAFNIEWNNRWQLHGFLARRSSKEFLEDYLRMDPGILERIVKHETYRYYAPEVALAVRLHEFGLLPESQRQQLLHVVTDYATRGQDLQALNDSDIQSLFSEQEFGTLLRDVRSQLFPSLADVRKRWEREYDPDESTAEEHMGKVLEWFDILFDHFGEDADAVTILSRETKHAREWIVSYTPDEPKKGGRTLGEVDADTVGAPNARSIFDDIDA